jgi:virginiamycin B lyase
MTSITGPTATDIALGRSRHPRHGVVRRVICLGLALAGATAAWAAVAIRVAADSSPAVTEFPVSPPGSNAENQAYETSMVTGPDGAVWFIWMVNTTSGLGRITTAGAVTTYPAPTGYSLTDLASGAGYLWVTEWASTGQSVGPQFTHYIGQWSTEGAQLQLFPLPPADAVVDDLAWGSDGALWFTAGAGETPGGSTGGVIGRMTTAGWVTNQYSLPLAAGNMPEQNGADNIIDGPDGALWFGIPSAPGIGRITTSGAITVYPIPGAAAEGFGASDQLLAAGPDGNVWAAVSYPAEVVSITDGGALTSYAMEGGVRGIVTGTLNNLWCLSDTAVESISTTGAVTANYPFASGGSAGGPFTIGPDGNLWVAAAGEIVQLAVSNPPPATPAPVTPDSRTPPPTPSPTPSATPIPPPPPTSTPSPSAYPLPTPVPVTTPTSSPAPIATRPTSARSRPATRGFAWPVVVVVVLVVLLGAGSGWLWVRRRRSRI